MTTILSKETKTISNDVENHPQFLKYLRLLDQYLEITNNEGERQRKFFQLAAQSQKLKKLGIFSDKENKN